MIVGEMMVKDPTTVKKTDPLKKAQDLMGRQHIRHLPVTEKEELVGIITESDIREAFVGAKTKDGKVRVLNPAKMKVGDYMTINPMVVTPETHIEDAALLIYKNKIGALPVIKRNKLVGIVSILDILGLFVDMMGILHSSSRIDVIMDKDPKNFDKVSNIFQKSDVNIISVGMSPYPKDKKKRIYFFRVELCDTHTLVQQIEKAGFKISAAIN